MDFLSRIFNNFKANYRTRNPNASRPLHELAFIASVNNGDFSAAFHQLAQHNEENGASIRPWEILDDKGRPVLTEARFSQLHATHQDACNQLKATFSSQRSL